ncbi:MULTISPECIES: TetR/AcrR family transcriptional regulator [Clostridium]|uniref:TetR/AcrR family transcriptional regulator n=1 Tax=Clostridium TaxID=1485 RepID=UPI00069F0BD7|nr:MULTISPECIES: TetR/AcrR family transcriptional regulator [Clostridium]MCD2345676.1 TetR/AcrR family transcriptional regulator [Clostridium guangxiense]
MSRITKAPEERRQEIIETALQIFQEKGYENTTIKDIAGRMNVAQGLCYRYFKSKQEIFAATSDYYALNFVDHIKAPLLNDNIVDNFNLIILRMLEYAVKHEEFEAAFKKEPEISAARLERITDQVVELMIPIVNKGVEKGIFECSDVPTTVRFLTFGLVNIIHHDMPEQNIKDHILSFTNVIKTICKNVLQSTDENIGANWDDL